MASGTRSVIFVDNPFQVIGKGVAGFLFRGFFPAFPLTTRTTTYPNMGYRRFKIAGLGYAVRGHGFTHGDVSKLLRATCSAQGQAPHLHRGLFPHVWSDSLA